MFACKVPVWSRIGRLRRATMPKVGREGEGDRDREKLFVICYFGYFREREGEEMRNEIKEGKEGVRHQKSSPISLD